MFGVPWAALWKVPGVPEGDLAGFAKGFVVKLTEPSLGPVLEPSWGRLEAFWSPLGALFGASRGRVGASWGVLGAVSELFGMPQDSHS